MTWVLLAAWLICATGVGLPLALNSLVGENRLFVLLSFSIVVGVLLQTVLLLLLWGVFPLGSALFVVIVFSLIASLLWAGSSRALALIRSMVWGLDTGTSIALVLLMAIFAVVGHRIFTAAYTAWDAEALYWHSSLVGWIGKGPFPPTSPLEPDDLVHYRFGFHALPAAVASVTGQLAPEALASTVALSVPMIVLATTGLSMRSLGSPRPGFLAALVGLLGGSLLPTYRMMQSLLGRPIDESRAHEMLGGLLSAGNTLDMLHNNVSIGIGFVYAIMALWVTWEFSRRTRPSIISAGSAMVALAALGLVNEVYFAALTAGFVAACGFRVLPGRLNLGGKGRLLSGTGLLVVGAAVAIVAVRGGFLGGIQLAEDAPNSVRLAINTDRFGHVPAPPGIWEPRWIPLLSPDAMIDSVFIIFGLPAMALVAARRRDLLMIMVTFASVAVLLAWLAVYPRNAPYDGYRFYQAAFSFYLLAALFALAPLFAVPASRSLRARWLLGGLIVALLILPHALFAVWTIIYPPVSVVATVSCPDYEPSLWLRESSNTSRVLVPLETTTQNFMVLYDSGNESGKAMRSILGMSKHVVPIGHGGQYWNPEPYIRPYRQASLTFEREALRELKVDWLYILPSKLGQDQSDALTTAQLKGEITLERTFGERGTGGERWLFKIVPSSPAK